MTDRPQQCAPPYFCPDAGASAQKLCPTGFYCPDVGMCEARECPLGTWVSCAGKERCDPCPEGRYCPSVLESLLCPAGFYCPASTYAPIPCPPGTHCYVGAKVPAPCEIGEYSPQPQQESCLPCPGSAVVGASACSARRRALLAADGSESGEAAEATLTDAAKGGAIGMAAAAGYAACTLGALALTGMVARRTTVVQGLKQGSAAGPAAAAAATAAVAPDATTAR